MIVRAGGRALATGVVALLALAACTGDDDRTRGPSATATGSETSPAPTPTDVDASPTAAPSGGGAGPAVERDLEALTVAIQDPRSLDPMRIQNTYSLLVARQLFEGLTRWDQERGEVVGAAAKSWEAARNDRRFTFTLRRGMTFHDGTPVTARDFEYAFDRIALQKNASDLAYTLERVRGFDDVNQLGRERTLEGVRAPDDRTLVIELDEPFAELPAVLTHPGLVPVPRDAARDSATFLEEPVGNGPFRMSAPWQGSGPIELEAFDGFYDPVELEAIRFVTFPEAAASWVPFVDGQIDVAEVPVNQFVQAASAYGKRGYQPLLLGYFYGFNLDARGLGDIRLRKAIGRAIDRERIAQEIYKGTLQPPRGIVPNAMPGFRDDACGKLCDHSLGAARSYVRKLPKRARDVTLEFPNDEPNAPQHREVAAAIRDDLEAAGLDVELRDFPFEKYLERLRTGGMHFYRIGWSAEYPVADDFLSPLFESDAPDNGFGFSSRKVDSLLRKARSEDDPKRRVAFYAQAEEEILEQAPILPIGFFVTHFAAQPRVEGIHFDMTGGFDAATISLADGG